MWCADWLGTNFKMNSDGQLRHFNCTIPGHRERERATRGERKESHPREGGEAETARKRRKTDRGCAVCGATAVVGGWTGTRNDRPSAHAYNYNNIT